MTDYNLPHNLVLENQEKLSITGISDVDTFDENKIVLFLPEDTLIIEGDSLHIQKLDITSGEVSIEGDIYSLNYTGSPGGKSSKGFFKKMLK